MVATSHVYASFVASYDSLNRLIRVDYGDGTSITHQYDAAGNMTQRQVVGSAVATCTAISGSSTATINVASSYSATCANTTNYVWKLNGTTISACTTASCSVTFTSTGANTLTVAPSTATNNTASLAVTVSATPTPTCSLITGPQSIPATSNSQTYTATCSNTSSYVWSLDGTTIPSCTTATCSVSFPANTTAASVNRVVGVAPSSNTASIYRLPVGQAGASVPLQCTGAASGQTAIPSIGGTYSYTANCNGAARYTWTVNGALNACTTSTCSVAFPANETASAVAYSIAFTAFDSATASYGASPLSVTVAAAPTTASLDFNGDGTVNSTDALLFNRWLLGFRGSSLVDGVTPYPAGTTTAAFATAVTNRMVLGFLHDLDNDTRVLAETDGLIFMRLTQGLTGAAVTNGALGAGALRNSHELIRTHVNSAFGTNFAGSPTTAITLAKLSEYKYGDVWRDGTSTWAMAAKVVDANDRYVDPDGTPAVRNKIYLLGLLDSSLVEVALGEAYLQQNSFAHSAVRVQSTTPNDVDVFWSEKRASGTYAMAGVRAVVRRADLAITQRSDLFTTGNMGWHPWLAADGVHHFSYAGGYHMLNTSSLGSITASAFIALWDTERATHSSNVLPATTDADVAARLCAIHCLPQPTVSIDTTQAALTAMSATFPAAAAYSFVTGTNGRTAVKFNGVSNPGAIRIPNSAAMQFTTGATFDLWARIDSNTGMNGNSQTVTGGWAMALVAKSHDSGSVSLNAFANDPNFSGSGYGFASWASSVPGWGTGTCTFVNRNPGAALGAWFRLTAVASTTAGTRVYHNKQLIYSCPSAVPDFTGMNGQDLYLGQYDSFWYPLNGAIQDIRIYQQALTEAQVQALP